MSGALLEFYYPLATTGDSTAVCNSIEFIMHDLQFNFILHSVHYWAV